jgi:hypothetical protein
MLIHKHSVKHNVVQTYREGGQPSALRLREELKRRLLGPRQMRYPPHNAIGACLLRGDRSRDQSTRTQGHNQGEAAGTQARELRHHVKLCSAVTIQTASPHSPSLASL